jgi:nitrite reductase/ring-hydroxylating ferredoxin subunit
MVATFTSSLLQLHPRRRWFCMSFAISAAIWTLLPASGFVLKGLGVGGGGGAGRRQLLLPLEDWRVAPTNRFLTKKPPSYKSPSSSTASSSISASTTPDTSATPQRSQQEGPGRWDSFDYLQHWYPVAWKVDMPVGAPTKQTLFDQDYAVVVTPNDEVLAFVDKCPHRSAALSEGRVVSGGRYLQCAYHGWSFGANGTCVDIPQSSGSPQTYSPRACAKAVPAILHQGLVWLWPGPDPPHKMPPTVPELDDPAFKSVAAGEGLSHH